MHGDTSQPSRFGSVDVERHDGDEQAVCVGQWCCGCTVHPIGKPWGWNYMAWERHNDECHPIPPQPSRAYTEADFA